ncbi:FixH family protein [Tsuneonella mangrovi]|uniref:FixH family protein n=1 Tax=Tsuneonella mangrovi TaxID=1982042 RepID=UPI000BA2BB4B|nr:FixH family protein [Tsuneonella mangrovi]
MKRNFTGWHMTGILVCFFGTVMAVNFYMATQAIEGFGGLVVENSYVASQHYNKWLAEARAEDALGWNAQIMRDGKGRLEVTTAGTPGDLSVTAELQHPLGKVGLQYWTLEQDGNGRFVSRDRLPEGRWLIRATLRSGGKHKVIERSLG